MKKSIQLFKIGFLLVLFLVIFSATTHAQIVYDGNGASANGSSLAFSVPAGTNRLIAISICNFGTVTNISYNGINATLGVTETVSGSALSSIFYIPLGSGGLINSTITVTGGANIIMGAGSFQNIDQTSPLGNTSSTSSDITGNILNPSLNLTSATGNLVFDRIFSPASSNPTPDASQTLVFSADNGVSDGVSSFKIATSGTTNMNQTFVGANAYSYSALEFIAAPLPIVATAPIPTMSQWGLLIFGLLIMNLSVFFVQRRELI